MAMSSQGWRTVVNGGSASSCHRVVKAGDCDVLRYARPLLATSDSPESHKVGCGKHGVDIAITGQDCLAQPTAHQRPVALSYEAGPEPRTDGSGNPRSGHGRCWY